MNATILTPITYPDGTAPKPTHSYCEGCWLDKKVVRHFSIDSGYQCRLCSVCVKRTIKNGGALYIQRAYELA